ncbi:MAG: hypothetical protein Q6352_014525 [Candidatus Freyrarchaeum guaymaensis]|nr:hypothetical protein [Candidatus Sigynarchaeota archaeon]
MGSSLEEAERETRKHSADWEFIRSQPPKKIALKLFVENEDLYGASRLAGLTVDEFDKLRIKAKLPLVVWREND